MGTRADARKRKEEAEGGYPYSLVAEINHLKQMMWEAYAILGFDTDGDETYHARVGWPDSFLDACREFRKDYDELLDELP